MEIGSPSPASDDRGGAEFMNTPVPPCDENLSLDLLEFRFVIDWLMTVAGVSSPRLAGLFGTSAENIRRLKYLAARQIEPSLITFVPELDLEPSTAIHAGVGIRSYRDILIHSEKPSPTTEGLREQIDI